MKDGVVLFFLRLSFHSSCVVFDETPLTNCGIFKPSHS